MTACKKQLVLASKSLRRSGILKNAGIPFTVRVQEADETLPDGISPEKAVMLLAERKAEAVARSPDELVLGADTVVALGDKILGKPISREDAFDMLSRLSGREHSVYTGVCALSDGEKIIFYEKTDVRLINLSEEEIFDYLDSGEPFDKAGSYGIQGLASKFIKSIKGDYFNVVGLPISAIYENIFKKK